MTAGATPQTWSVAAWALPPEQLEAVLADHLSGDVSAAWQLDRDRVRADPGALGRLFPATARTVGRAPLHPDDPTGLLGTVDDLARALLLLAAGGDDDHDDDDDDVDDLAGRLYRSGDAAERRAVLRALAHLPGPADAALVEDALRTNDTRLVAAALGPAADALDQESWRQAVLKCLFVGVPLSCVHRLVDRADDTLAVMAARYVAERVAAGRDVPADVGAVLPPTSAAMAQAGLDDAGHGGHPDRLAAAARARELLSYRPTPRET